MSVPFGTALGSKRPAEEFAEKEAAETAKAAARLALVGKYKAMGYSAAETAAVLKGHGIAPEDVCVAYAGAAA